MSNIVTTERHEPVRAGSVTDGRQSGIGFVVAGIFVVALLALTLGLWAAVGTTVFFEMMRAGFVACFG